MFVLLVEDNDGDALLLTELLRNCRPAPSGVDRVDRLSEATRRLGEGGVDTVLLDLSLPDSEGLESIEGVRAAAPEVAIVVLTGHDDEELGARAVQAGAQDYLIKGRVDGPLLARAMRYAAERQRMLSSLEQQVAERTAELREADQELRRTRQLEAVARLAAGVAHDFNNDLAVVLCASEILAAGLAADDPRQDEVRAISQAATRGASLTRRLLAFGGRGPSPPTDPGDPASACDFNDAINHMQPLLGPLLGGEISLRLDLSPRSPRGAIAREELERIVLNLCTNARDAMPSGGKLSISTDITEDPGEPAVAVLLVADTGVGMDEEARSRAFEPFFTTKGGDGTGLGLSGVFGAARSVGGDVRIVSRTGQGTEVALFVPLTAGLVSPREAGLTPAESAEELMGDETVMLVDDDPLLLRMVRRILSKQGYTVLSAADGEAAQRFWRPYPGGIDLLVTDVVMPRVVGPELARALRDESEDLPVVFMSAHLSADPASSPATDRHTALLPKPFAAEALLRSVRGVLGGPGRPPPEGSWTDPMIGRVIADRFAVYGVLGHGGMGAVYLARQANMERMVALKLLDRSVARSANSAQWLRNEARAASKLRSRHTISVYDFGETDDDLLYLAMELLEGEPLDDLVREGGVLSVERTCTIAAQVCRSLAEAHEHGVIHRDIKPGNVFVCRGPDGEDVKVLDFGIAALRAAPTLERDGPPSGVAVGTPDYMAPEHARGLQLDGRADLYGLGVLLYRCLSGRMPFQHVPRDAVLRTKVRKQAPPLERVCGGDDPPPGELVDLVTSLLRINPDERPGSAVAVGERLEAISTVARAASPG